MCRTRRSRRAHARLGRRSPRPRRIGRQRRRRGSGPDCREPRVAVRTGGGDLTRAAASRVPVAVLVLAADPARTARAAPDSIRRTRAARPNQPRAGASVARRDEDHERVARAGRCVDYRGPLARGGVQADALDARARRGVLGRGHGVAARGASAARARVPRAAVARGGPAVRGRDGTAAPVVNQAEEA
jgi:hypothetical protein